MSMSVQCAADVRAANLISGTANKVTQNKTENSIMPLYEKKQKEKKLFNCSPLIPTRE